VAKDKISIYIVKANFKKNRSFKKGRSEFFFSLKELQAQRQSLIITRESSTLEEK
jgi:hypothetical protein